MERETFPHLLQQGRKVAIYQGCNYWLDIGTPEKYIQAHRDNFEGKLRLSKINFGQRAVCGSNARIHNTAVLRGPVYLGDNVRIGANAVVGPSVVIGDNSVIGRECEISGSILWNNVVVEAGAKMADCIVTHSNTVKSASRHRHVIFSPDTVKAAGI